MRKFRDFQASKQDWEDSDCKEQDCSQYPSHLSRFHPRHMYGPHAKRYRSHHPDKWRSNRRAIFFFGLLFSILTILIISGGILVAREIIALPDHPSIRDEPGRMFPFAIILLIIGAIFVIGRFSRRSFSSPLEKILDAADRIAEGDFSTRIEGIRYGPFGSVETAINHMVAELERSDQLRREQTADIAHELNTPIHIIRGYLEGISDGIYEADDEMLSLLMEETSLLSRLVDDLRLLSLADAGQLPTHPEEVNLKAVLEDIQVSFMGQAKEEQIDFSIDAETNVVVKADPSHIYRIINNLVSNALSYTDSDGAVSLTLVKEQDGAVLTIADTGQGMSEEDLVHAFDRFWRKDKSRQRKDGGGYGLGLTIVQQLVFANGGEIELESELGKGTTFRLMFPCN